MHSEEECGLPSLGGNSSSNGMSETHARQTDNFTNEGFNYAITIYVCVCAVRQAAESSVLYLQIRKTQFGKRCQLLSPSRSSLYTVYNGKIPPILPATTAPMRTYETHARC